MNRELKGQGIKSTALCPAFVDTAMTDFMKDRLAPEDMIQVADIVESVRFLLRLTPGCVVPEIVFTGQRRRAEGADRMKLALSIGYWGSGNGPAQQLATVQEAERLGYDSAWVAEAYGSDAATVLGGSPGTRPPSASAPGSSRCPHYCPRRRR